MIFTIEERVDYYTANLKKKNIKYNIEFDLNTETCYYYLNGIKRSYTDIMPTHYYICCIDKDYSLNSFDQQMSIKQGRSTLKKEMGVLQQNNVIGNYYKANYINPIIKLFNSDDYFMDSSFLHRPGDVFFNTEIPIITKTRPRMINSLNDSYYNCLKDPDIKNMNGDWQDNKKLNNVLINLDSERHWNIPIKQTKENDIPFEEKNNKIIWRGSCNGFLWSNARPSRLTLVQKYVNHSNPMIDIGFTHKPDYVSCNPKDYKSIKEQLESKFLISVEGGDVATNLKWILYSNSCPLLPHPTISSWLMEEKLKPWIHYIPLGNKFEDLEEKYEWCLHHQKECKQIAMNGKKYVEQFLDHEREAKITNLVLREYVDNVTITKI